MKSMLMIALALLVGGAASTADAKIKNLIVEFKGKKIDDAPIDSQDPRFQKRVNDDLKKAVKALKLTKPVVVATWFRPINGAAIQIDRGTTAEYQQLIGKIRGWPYVLKADFDGRVD